MWNLFKINNKVTYNSIYNKDIIIAFILEIFWIFQSNYSLYKLYNQLLLSYPDYQLFSLGVIYIQKEFTN